MEDGGKAMILVISFTNTLCSWFVLSFLVRVHVTRHSVCCQPDQFMCFSKTVLSLPLPRQHFTDAPISDSICMGMFCCQGNPLMHSVLFDDVKAQ